MTAIGLVVAFLLVGLILVFALLLDGDPKSRGDIPAPPPRGARAGARPARAPKAKP